MYSPVLIFIIACVTITSSTPVLNLTDDVSVDSSSRIVNGYEVDITEVPYQASLRRKSSSAHFCGGVIIDEQVVLTAAHCVDGYQYNPSSLVIVVGTTSRFTGGIQYEISRILVHESYLYSTLENDIAIMKIDGRMTFNQYVNAIGLPARNFELPNGSEALVSGFGTTSFEGSSSLVLLAAKVWIVDQDTCARTYRRMATITNGMICAGGSDPPRDACQGDSGGPLVSNNRLVGIVSWGEGCADQVYPGVYTRVSTYSSWIKQSLANE